jgi:hypothetical protein
MKRIVLFLLLLIGSFNLNAQINEIGVLLGGSNYIGDIGKTNYINPKDVAFGIDGIKAQDTLFVFH